MLVSTFANGQTIKALGNPTVAGLFINAIAVLLVPVALAPVLILEAVLLHVLIQHLVGGIVAFLPFAGIDEVGHGIGPSFLGWRLDGGSRHAPGLIGIRRHTFVDLVFGDVPHHHVGGQGQRQNIYQEGEVETWIAPLLRQAEKLSPAGSCVDGYLRPIDSKTARTFIWTKPKQSNIQTVDRVIPSLDR